MENLQFQFQYDARDLQAIRSVNGLSRVSPGTTITVWIFGLFLCVLMLAAMGAWSMVLVVIVVFVAFLVFHICRSNGRRLGDREYHLRSLTLSNRGVHEMSGDSEFEKSWSAFQEFYETNDHFLLRHYDKLTALPKRVVSAEQLPVCRDLFRQRIVAASETSATDEVPSFQAWFNLPTRTPVYRFRWHPADAQDLASARLQPFDSHHPVLVQDDRTASHRGGLVLILMIGLLLIIMVWVQLRGGIRLASAVNMILFPVAISIPFLVAYGWWKYTAGLASQREPRIPDAEIQVALSDSALLIGYAQAVARYSLQDISSFYFGERFIGFRPHHGPIYVIANRAFGGSDRAFEFLRRAEELQRRESSRPTDGSSPRETGNPYQPPGNGI